MNVSFVKSCGAKVRPTFWYSPLGEYYCHCPRSDSCRHDFYLVPLICRLWNALSTSGSSVTTTFIMWELFRRGSRIALESFCVPTLHNPNVNMCPFTESSFWYQALQLFRIVSPWQEILTNPTEDNLLYFEIVKVKVLFANHNTAQSSAFRTYHCAVDRS